MVDAIRATWTMLDHPVDKSDAGRFAEMKRVFEKSIVSAVALPAGTVIETAHLAFKKPGDGIPAADYGRLLGRRLRVDVPADHKFRLTDFQET
jgi:N-acetylneuraminate synthase